MLRLVQIMHQTGHRHVAVADEPWLRPVANFHSVYELAIEAIRRGGSIANIVEGASRGEQIAYDAVYYDAVYNGQSDWKLLPPIDHPDEPASCLVTGTGLTHKASAENRNSMHVAGDKPAA